jgi:simple sugar transport system ATP-binding protein
VLERRGETGFVSVAETTGSDGTPTVPRLRLCGITKRFPGVVANRDVDLEVYGGEVLAILGENGAGKSTLMNVVSGMLQPDAGSIEIDGKPVRIRNPSDARKLGIGMVYQHFALVPTLTVAENLALAASGSRIFSNTRRIAERVTALSRAYHLEIDPHAVVGDLSVGTRQRVEIVKLLFRGAEILIFDEPTSVLTPVEWQHLVKILRNLAAEGHSIIFITHKLDELMQVADRCTVLRHGEVAGTVSVANTDKAQLARMTVGRDVLFEVSTKAARPGDVVVAASDLTLRSDQGRARLDGVSFELRQGEILGVAGVDGNGQRELARVLTGLERATAGQFRFGDEWRTSILPIEFSRRGGAYIPEDRHRTSVALDLSVRDNLLMKELALGRFQRGGVISERAGDQFCDELMKEFDIRAPSSRVRIRQLSGGNQQKVVLARELARRPKFLIAAQPTRGLDVGAAEFVLRRLETEKERGCAILMISTELEEVLQLADRIAVMVDGRFLAVLDRREATYERLGLLLGGEAVDDNRTDLTDIDA